MNKFEKLINRYGTILVGVIGLVGIVAATAGVVSRFVLKVSLSWTDELLRTIFVWGYFVGAALIYQEGGIMRLELVQDSLGRRGKNASKKILNGICEIINLIFFSISTYYVGNICFQHIARGTTSGTSKTPAWVLPLSYGVGCLLIALFAVRNIIHIIANNESQSAEEDK